jgi:hypothetical protein
MLTGLRTVIAAAGLCSAAALTGMSVAAMATGGFGPHHLPADPPRPVLIDPTPPPVLSLTTTTFPRATAIELAAWSATLSGDSYQRVRDHPDLTSGDNIRWTCAISRPLGRDARTGDQLVGCDHYGGVPGAGRTGGPLVLRFAASHERFEGSLDAGAVVVVWGTVTAPYRDAGHAARPQVRVYLLAPASYPAPAIGGIRTDR